MSPIARDISQETKIVQSIAAQSVAVGTLNGAAADCQNFDQAAVIVDSGTLTAGTVDVKVQEADEAAGSWSDVPGAVFPQITSANDVATYIGFVDMGARKRLLRVVAVVGTLASLVSADILLVRASGAFDGVAPSFSV